MLEETELYLVRRISKLEQQRRDLAVANHKMAICSGVNERKAEAFDKLVELLGLVVSYSPKENCGDIHSRNKDIKFSVKIDYKTFIGIENAMKGSFVKDCVRQVFEGKNDDKHD